MIQAFRAYGDSVAYRWVTRSRMATFFTQAPPPVAPVLENAVFLRATTLPHTQGLATLVAAVGLLIALFYGYGIPAAMLGVFLVALYYPTLALGCTPALLIWAPRLPLATLGDEIFFLRLDQAAIAGMLVALVTNPRLEIRTPPAHTAFLLYLMVIVVSIIAGGAQGTLTTPTSALLYLAQWLTWYALFVAAYSLAPGLGNTTAYVWGVPLIALAGYGLAENAWPLYEDPGVAYRTFERGLFPGQANHAGGLFALATVTGIALATVPRHRILGLALAILASLALLPTGSRSGALAWMAGCGTLALLYCPPLRWWTPPLAVLAVVALPTTLWYRFSAPGSSMYDRLVAWKSALSTVADFPVLGLGAGARHRSFYDNHFVMTLAESGFLGLLLMTTFLALLFRATANPMAQPRNWMATGACAALVAMVVHSMATSTFIVTLVAGPFFWYYGVTLRLTAPRP